MLPIYWVSYDTTLSAFATTRMMPTPRSIFLLQQSTYRNGKATSPRRQDPLLRVVSHLANGAKHFQANDPKHQSVSNVGSRLGSFSRGSFQADAFDTGGLFVELSGGEATVFGAKVEVIDLAKQVLAFWERRLAS